jgi:hypothetical protein
MVNEASVGPVSLVLNFPAELAELQDVIMCTGEGNLQWAVKGDEIRISWHSPDPLNLASSDRLLILQMKTTASFTIGNSIRIALASTPLNELADEMFNVIGDVILSAESIDASAVGIAEQNITGAIGLSCYPNPTHDFTLFTYSLAYEGRVTLEINNLLGYQLAMPVNEAQESGDHICKFDTYGLPSGIYTATLRLRSGKNESVKTVKLIINK